jgi:hypothetical protein
VRFDLRASLVLALGLAAAPSVAPAQRPAPANPHVRLGGKTCTDCHTTAGWREVRFDHRQTSFQLLGQHQTVLCAACHDLRDFSHAATTCSDCHADPHRGDAGSRCEQCHSEIGWRQVGAQNAHARTRLPDLGVHTSLRCEDCHRQTGARQFTGRVAPCVTCHQATYDATTEPAHSAMGLPAQCETCHQFTTWSFARFPQHDGIFPVYAGAHAGVWSSCLTCHTDPSTYRVFVCITCHTQPETDPRHQGIPGYQWQSTSCLACHPDGRSGGFTQHDAVFPISSGTHAGTWSTCAECHTDPNNRQVFSCTAGACHAATPTNGLHQGIPGYLYTSSQCLSCHPTGLRGTFTQHDPLFFPIFSGSHAARWTACADCHTDPNKRPTFSCMTGACHAQATTDAGHSGIVGYQYAAAQCRSCHPDGTAGGFPQHDAVFPINSGTHAGQWTACAECHTDPANRQVFSCMSGKCHVATTTNALHQGIPGYAYTAAQCLVCHPTGLRGTFAQHDALFFPIYSGRHSGRWRDDCTVCHQDANRRDTFTCMSAGCHAQSQTNSNHSGVRNYVYAAASCYSCHPRGNTNAAPIVMPKPPGAARPTTVPGRQSPPLEAALRTYRVRVVDGRWATRWQATSG